jgi:hypothetical protein
MIRSTLRRFRDAALRDVYAQYPARLQRQQTDNKAAQLSLQMHYRALASTPGAQRPALTDVGFRQYSQCDEDGILLYLFSLIGTVNKTCVEICAADGLECNTTNLIINHGWWGHLFDGSDANVTRGRAFFSGHKDTFIHPPAFTQAWITAEGVNEVIERSGVSGRIDLLSLDLDGVDYWVWKAITIIDPVVVVCEVHNPVPPDVAVTVPYRQDFAVASFLDLFRGASLAAMVKLGAEKGYRLVGTNRYGFNAFFVKRGVGEALLPEVSAESCARDPYTRAQQARWPTVRDREWVHV